MAAALTRRRAYCRSLRHCSLSARMLEGVRPSPPSEDGEEDGETPESGGRRRGTDPQSAAPRGQGRHPAPPRAGRRGARASRARLRGGPQPDLTGRRSSARCHTLGKGSPTGCWTSRPFRRVDSKPLGAPSSSATRAMAARVACQGEVNAIADANARNVIPSPGWPRRDWPARLPSGPSPNGTQAMPSPSGSGCRPPNSRNAAPGSSPQPRRRCLAPNSRPWPPACFHPTSRPPPPAHGLKWFERERPCGRFARPWMAGRTLTSMPPPRLRSSSVGPSLGEWTIGISIGTLQSRRQGESAGAVLGRLHPLALLFQPPAPNSRVGRR